MAPEMNAGKRSWAGWVSALLVSVGCSVNTSLAQQPVCGWELASQGGPTERSDAEIVYDSTRDRMILFGGYEGEWPNGEWATDLWSWDGSEWEQIDDGTGPGPDGRQAFWIIYDSHFDQIVLFGGGYGGQPNVFYSDTWIWNCKTEEWREVNTPGPSGRWSCAMTYDSSLGEGILFGGTPDANSLLNDTWIWSGYTETWTQVASNGPSARDNSSMTFDVRSGRGLLFGGFCCPPDRGDVSRRNDLWSWDGRTRSWTLVHDGSGLNVPGVRNGHGLAYDHARGVVVLFGGHTAGNNYPETWEWDGILWKQRANFGPPGRFHHAMAYDQAHGVTVVIGGANDAGDRFPQTWVWGGSVRGDYNGDGTINTIDFLDFLNDWAAGCP